MNARSQTQISLVTNTGPNCLLPYLRRTGASCKQVDIAVAFITASGLESVLHLLQQVARKGRVRILTGLYQGFTEPRALSVLLREQKESENRISVRISRDKRFHWKSYFLIGSRTATAIVGSSNMTSEGLLERGELNLALSTQPDATSFRKVHGPFGTYWDKQSQVLTKEIVARYSQWRGQQPTSPSRSVPLARILGKAVETDEHADSARRKRCWRLSKVGSMGVATEDLLAKITDWDEKEYETLSTHTSRIRPGDRAIMFDCQARQLSVVEIMEHVETPDKTPDGRHFIAYRAARFSTRKRFTPRLWAVLREKKIVTSETAAEFIHTLPEKAYRAAEELLRRK
jgi:HKD family nuclease